MHSGAEFVAGHVKKRAGLVSVGQPRNPQKAKLAEDRGERGRERGRTLVSPLPTIYRSSLSLSDLVLKETQNVADLEFCDASMCWAGKDGCFWGEKNS